LFIQQKRPINYLAINLLSKKINKIKVFLNFF